MRIAVSVLAPVLLAGAAWAAPTAGGPHVPGAPGCSVFPPDNAFNRRVDRLPVAADSARLIATIGAGTGLHPDFGSVAGIPYAVVGRRTRRSRVSFDYAAESDRGPYPIPARPPIEAGSDHHLLLVDRDACRLYELFAARRTPTGWHAGSGAIWSLRSNRLRPRGWTSADAAGLPILAGLARYGEVHSGVINHALRFTVAATQSGYILPATHSASSSTDKTLPVMGLRLRLNANYDLSRFHGQALVILKALKQYGMMVADNGSSWFITGAADPRWNDEDLNQLKTVPGIAFEAVKTGPIHH